MKKNIEIYCGTKGLEFWKEFVKQAKELDKEKDDGKEYRYKRKRKLVS